MLMKPVRMSMVPASTFAPRHGPERWIADGWQMARREGSGVFESIDHKHAAEGAACTVTIESLKARGRGVLEQHRRLDDRLKAMAFDPAEHLRDLAQGRVDLAWAIVLTLVNAALAMLVLSIGAGPMWITGLLAFLVLVTAVPVEEFFSAHEEKTTLREGLFLFLSILALGASFWLGTLRGLFISSEYGEAAGPANELLRFAGVVLRYALGILALVSEVLAGFKWFQVRRRLASATARTVRTRDNFARQLVRLHTAIKASEAEPDIRRRYRMVGARQYLATSDTNGTDAQRFHLHRAAIGAAIALLALLALLFLASRASAAPSTRPRPRVVLLDLTQSTSPESFSANLQAINTLITTAPDDTKVLVAGITDSFGHPQLLLEELIQVHGSTDLEGRAAREIVLAKWRRAAAHLQPSYGRTNLIGALNLLRYVTGQADLPFDLYVLSDGRENVRLDFDRVPQIAVGRSLADVKKTGGIPPLPNVEVFMLGVNPTGKTAAYFASLQAFWSGFFQAAGASLRAFRVDRQIAAASR